MTGHLAGSDNDNDEKNITSVFYMGCFTDGTLFSLGSGDPTHGWQSARAHV